MRIHVLICRYTIFRRADKPEIVSNTSALSGGEFTSLTIPCSYDANPVPTQISWRKDGVGIDLTSASYSGGTPGTPGLTITSLGIGDAGSYQCTVVNARGNVTSGSIAVTVTCKSFSQLAFLKRRSKFFSGEVTLF